MHAQRSRHDRRRQVANCHAGNRTREAQTEGYTMTGGSKKVTRKTILPGSYAPGMTPAPTHGPNGSHVVRADIVIDCPVTVYRCDPPRRPDRLITIVDDDGDVIEYRDATDEEFGLAMHRYTEASVEWMRTGGTVRVPGPSVIRATVVCEDGSTANGEFAGSWRWLSCEGGDDKRDMRSK